MAKVHVIGSSHDDTGIFFAELGLSGMTGFFYSNDSVTSRLHVFTFNKFDLRTKSTLEKTLKTTEGAFFYNPFFVATFDVSGEARVGILNYVNDESLNMRK